MKKTLTIAACLATGLAAASGAYAQTNSGAQPATTSDDEDTMSIVVTASRRQQNVQDVPGAVTAFGGQYIEDLRLTNARDFTQLIPNAVFEEGGFNINQSISIRGVRPGQDISEPGFGYYRDGQYMGGLRTNFTDVMDLARVEVLRGPQGSLYGRNAVGGAINFVYNRPDLDAEEGSMQFGYGSYDRVEGRGTVNIPLSSTLGARFNGWYVDQTEGQFHNVTLDEDVDIFKAAGARGQLRWQPTPDVDVNWTVERGTQSTPEFIGVQPASHETDDTIVSDTSSRADKTFSYAAQDVDWSTPVGTFSVLAHYRTYLLRSIGDQDSAATPNLTTTDWQLFSQAIRRHEDQKAYYIEGQWVSPAEWPVSWVAGLDYFNEAFQLDRPIRCTNWGGLLGPFAPVVGVTSPAPCGFSVSRTQFSLDTQSFAGFAEGTWHVTPTLDVIASARYNQDTKDLDLLRTRRDNSGNLILNVPVHDSATFDNTSYGGGIQWRATPDLNFYVRVNEGFRAGGYNTGINQANFEISRLPFNAETSVNYEVGAKSRWMDGALILNLAVFRLIQHDLQGFRPDIFNNFFVDNLGTGRTDGVELEGELHPFHNLTLTAGYGWLDGKLTSGPDAPNDILFGKGSNWNMNVIYRQPIAHETSLTYSLSWRRNDPDFSHVGSQLSFPIARSDYLNVNTLDGSVTLDSGRWQLRAFANNLNDDRYILGETFFAANYNGVPNGPPGPATWNRNANGVSVTYNQGRRVGLEASVKF